jgi:hypothetical protein
LLNELHFYGAKRIGEVDETKTCSDVRNIFSDCGTVKYGIIEGHL